MHKPMRLLSPWRWAKPRYGDQRDRTDCRNRLCTKMRFRGSPGRSSRTAQQLCKGSRSSRRNQWTSCKKRKRLEKKMTIQFVWLNPWNAIQLRQNVLHNTKLLKLFNQISRLDIAPNDFTNNILCHCYWCKVWTCSYICYSPIWGMIRSIPPIIPK